MVDAELDMKGLRICRSCNMNVLLFSGLTMVLRGHIPWTHTDIVVILFILFTNLCLPSTIKQLWILVWTVVRWSCTPLQKLPWSRNELPTNNCINIMLCQYFYTNFLQGPVQFIFLVLQPSAFRWVANRSYDSEQAQSGNKYCGRLLIIVPVDNGPLSAGKS